MSHLSKIFTKTPIDVPNKSGFDMSHENTFTGTTGTLIPVLCEELLPNDTISLGEMSEFKLPPAVANFYGRIDVRMEAFFVPNRLVWAGWQDFITSEPMNPYSPNTQSPTGTFIRPEAVPQIKMAGTVTGEMAKSVMGPGTLADYLGNRIYSISDQFDGHSMLIQNALPFLAYHKIYEDWYMNTAIQKTPFVRSNAGITAANYTVQSAPYLLSVKEPVYTVKGLGQTGVTTNGTFNDGLQLTDLRQRNYAKDYFTTATYQPQAGSESSLTFDVSTGDEVGSGSFTISALRSANKLQQWLERNNIAGYRYADQIQAQFGVLPSDATMNRSIFLGGVTHNVYNRSVYQTAGNGSTTGDHNEFSKQLGGEAASVQSNGEGSLIDKFTATEHGHVIVLCSLVPHANYATGRRRYLTRSKLGDFAFPLLQGVGNQAIYKAELTGYDPSYPGPTEQVFGYTDQYAEYKYHDDETHGLLRDSSNLQYFQLQRAFNPEDNIPELGTNFIQIGIGDLDGVLGTSTATSGFTYWGDIYFSFKKISTLSEYIIPTLGDLKNTHREYVDRNGRML